MDRELIGRTIMLKNYFKIALRKILKTKLFSLINILGLTIGITACLLILHYVTFEKSYDKFHPDYERIYRLRYERTDEQGESVRFASCCPPAAARIRDKYPEVKKIARLFHYQASVAYGEKKFLEEKMFFAEPDLFNILKFNFTKGNPIEDLKSPGNAFISRTASNKYFGNENPLGKTISIDKKDDYQIVGIFEDIPENSHLKFDIILPWQKLAAKFGAEYTEAWGHTGAYTYLILKPGTNAASFEKKLAGLVEQECPWLKEYKMVIDLKMQPLTDIHLNSNFMQEYEVNGNKDSVNFLFIIAIFIIVMAWVNYVNLSTARSINRAKEVGLRKVIGASRRQLVFQFFFEIIVVNLISIILAIIIFGPALSLFENITAIKSDYTFFMQKWFWIANIIMFTAGVLLSGFYPALVLSSYQPAKVLKGNLGNEGKGINLRKGLVVFQFAMAIGLIACTFAVYKQVKFLRSQSLGFDIKQTLVIKAPRVRDESYGDKFTLFKETILSNTNITNACHVTEVPGRQLLWDAGAIFKVGDDISKGKNYQIMGVDYDFVNFFNIKLIAGRNFSKEFSTDNESLLLNETAVKWMGFKDAKSAVGKKVNYWDQIFTIVGVLKDYHQQSPKTAFEPTLYRFMPTGRDVRGHFAVKLNTHNVSRSIDFIQKKYSEFFPANPFDYFFLNDYFFQQYKSDELLGKVFTVFALLAVIITSLGIFGLSSFSTVQRTKEIGIRKVLGASIWNVTFLLVKDFLFLIAISFIIIIPGLLYGITYWLDGFCKPDVTKHLAFYYSSDSGDINYIINCKLSCN